MARSTVYFPLIGALVGLSGSLTLLLIYSYLPPLLTVLVVMGVMVFLTGGLHEDGVADVADGLIGGQTVPRRLEIMKDSRIGSYAAMALWFFLTAKLVLLSTLLEHKPLLAFDALIAANALGRMAAVALLYVCRYVRAEGKAGPFGNAVSFKSFFIAGIFAVILTVAVLGPWSVVCLIAAFLTTWAARLYFLHKIGGITGDCLGAANQIVELGCYAALLVPLQLGAI
jgi:adenosylcobinamide-GDP ribazoletransferase